MSYTGSEGFDEAGRLRSHLAEARKRGGLANKNPEIEIRKVRVWPYLAREASVPLTAQYADFTPNQVLVAKTLLRTEGKLPEENSSEARVISRYEAFRIKKDSSEAIRGMLQLGRQLVEKGVITPDTAYWKKMHEEYYGDRNRRLPDGFRERLILEGFFVSQVLGRSKLETALRRELIRGGLVDSFDPDFDFLTQAASRIKAQSK